MTRPGVVAISPYLDHKLLGVLSSISSEGLLTQLTLAHFPSPRESLSFASVDNQTLPPSVFNFDLLCFISFVCFWVLGGELGTVHT